MQVTPVALMALKARNMSAGCNLPDPLPGGPISMLPSGPVKLHGSDRATVLPTKAGDRWADVSHGVQLDVGGLDLA
jgi:hypothetical protein